MHACGHSLVPAVNKRPWPRGLEATSMGRVDPVLAPGVGRGAYSQPPEGEGQVTSKHLTVAQPLELCDRERVMSARTECPLSSCTPNVLFILSCSYFVNVIFSHLRGIYRCFTFSSPSRSVHFLLVFPLCLFWGLFFIFESDIRWLVTLGLPF